MFVGFISLDFFWGAGEWLCFFSSYYSDLMFKNIFVSSVDITPKPQLGNEIQPPRFLPSSVPWPPFPSSFVIALIFFFPLKTGSVCVNSFSLDGRQHPAGFCPGPPRSGAGPSVCCCCCVEAQSCLTLRPRGCSPPGLPVHHQLPESTETHVHRVGDAIQPSHPLPSPSPAFSLSQHQGLFK